MSVERKREKEILVISTPGRLKKAVCREEHSKRQTHTHLLENKSEGMAVITGDMLVFSSAVMKC